ncbi:hypothetical protein PCARR_a3638 [Pseudoalteromonas carrageenovora IAM 12662]|uniref:Uncharacterized protein n=1 Tax=Pseudoalteromonas carrageenovora IAM 12662 TaxID=1314868 RepID=A0ABR9ES15_PSEVC|nr:hypothetical protein [Pseudoalteromonas carrageenovora IAM 12662]
MCLCGILGGILSNVILPIWTQPPPTPIDIELLLMSNPTLLPSISIELDVNICPDGVITFKFLFSRQDSSIPKCSISRRSITRLCGGSERRERTISPRAFLIVILVPTTSTSQLFVVVIHSLSTIFNTSRPSLSAKYAFIRNGAPSDSGGLIESTLSPFILIKDSTPLQFNVPIVIFGSTIPKSKGPKENPFCLQTGLSDLIFIVSFDNSFRVTRSWQPPHRRTIWSGLCSVASANVGSTCSY